MDFSNFVSFYTGLLNFYLFFKMNFSTFISFQAGWQGLLLLCLQEIQVQQRWPIGKTPVREKVGLPKKKTGFFGNFFQKGGGGHPNSQKCCKITKSFLACQIHPKVLKHVFHTEGSNIWSILSIKVYLIFSSSLREKNGLFWEFCPWVIFYHFAHFSIFPIVAWEKNIKC